MNPVIRAVLATARVQLTNTFSRPAFRFVAFIQPLVFVTITFFMFRHTGRSDMMLFVVMGSGMAGLWSSIIYSSAGDIDRERWMGTLESLFLAPVDFRAIMLGKVLGNGFLGMGSLVLSVLYATLIFGVRVKVSQPWVLALGLTVLILSCSVMALLLAPVFTLSRSSSALLNGLEYPFFVLSGILFPVESLPGWVQPFSYLLAPTWAMRILRQGFARELDVSLLQVNIACLLGLTLLYIAALGLLYRVMAKRARMDGTLGVD